MVIVIVIVVICWKCFHINDLDLSYQQRNSYKFYQNNTNDTSFLLHYLFVFSQKCQISNAYSFYNKILSILISYMPTSWYFFFKNISIWIIDFEYMWVTTFKIESIQNFRCYPIKIFQWTILEMFEVKY